jgi:hypothetical protein
MLGLRRRRNPIRLGDITHLSKPAEFDAAQQLFSRLRTTEMHSVPGEHDTADATPGLLLI